MTDPETSLVVMPDDRPPDWANSLMRWALNTPGIQAMVGQGVALLIFDGRRTGKPYAIPVSYHREGDVVTVVTKRRRNWWLWGLLVAAILLGILVADYLGADAVVVPVSANDAVDLWFEAKGIHPRKTRIGSPYVVGAMEELARELREDGAGEVSCRVRTGTEPYEDILDAGGNSVDTLVVMGTQGRGVVPGVLLGNVGKQVGRQAAARVLLIPGEDPEAMSAARREAIAADLKAAGLGHMTGEVKLR